MLKKSLYLCLMTIYLTWMISMISANTGGIIATHSTETPIYSNQTQISLTTTIEYSYTDIASLGLEISIPDNWKFLSFSDENLPLEMYDDIISTYWVNVPDRIHIEYQLEIPENEVGVQYIYALVKYRRHGIDDPLDEIVLPDPLELAFSEYYITATAGTGGQIVPSGRINVAVNQSQTFTIQAENGYTINELFVDNESVFATNRYIFNAVTENHIIDVNFIRKNYQLIIDSTNGGSVNPSGVLNVNHGETQVITITPDIGYILKSVMINGESVSLSNTELPVTALSNMDIDIAFVKNQLFPTHHCEDSVYEPEISVVIQSRIENPYELNVSALSMRVQIPPLWTFISARGDRPPDDIRKSDNIINFVWISGMIDDLEFNYTLKPAQDSEGPKSISAKIIYRISDEDEMVTPITPDIRLEKKISSNNSTPTTSEDSGGGCFLEVVFE